MLNTVFLYISVYIRLCFIQKTKHIDLSINSCIHVCGMWYMVCVICVCVSICLNEWTNRNGEVSIYVSVENHLVVLFITFVEVHPYICIYTHVSMYVNLVLDIVYIHIFICSYVYRDACFECMYKRLRQIYCSKMYPIYLRNIIIFNS